MMGGKVKGLRISLRFHRGNGPKKQAMKNPAGGPGFSGEGISFLMGCSKNYIMYWGVFTVIIVPYVPRKVCTNRDFFSFDSYSK